MGNTNPFLGPVDQTITRVPVVGSGPTPPTGFAGPGPIQKVPVLGNGGNPVAPPSGTKNPLTSAGTSPFAGPGSPSPAKTLPPKLPTQAKAYGLRGTRPPQYSQMNNPEKHPAYHPLEHILSTPGTGFTKTP